MSIPAPSDCVTAHAELRHCAREACGRRAEPHTLGRQRGAVLVIGLIMMTLLSLLGLTALGTGLLEERMTANARDRIRAFQAAEAALRSCETAITSGGSGGMYTPTYPPIWEDPNVWKDATKVHHYSGLPLVASQPSCIVERLSAEISAVPAGLDESLRRGLPIENERTYRHYRVTARGVGVSERTVVMLQSHIRLPAD